ncbi:hypothetical protein XENTR_v10012453 [Xenopus tropicalis]|uniref:Uncharacterized protein n=1 Tax=Xenopus tropicalis TaxID=8364 RepID=A0A803KC21_XENTR|nr:hypothetical protein XENTR_v10012453 [Xenopus tropicalis]
MKVSNSNFISTLTLLILVTTPHANKEFVNQYEKWNYREGANKVNIMGIRSITGFLEKWGNEIFSAGKDILMDQPELLLPDYTGIRSLAEALDDLLRDVNLLKKRLVELNERFEGINRVFARKRLRMAPRKPIASPKSVIHLVQIQEKLTQPPNRPYPVRRRVYIRRRKAKKPAQH